MSNIVEFVDKIKEAAKRGTEQTLPSASKDRYLKNYGVFNDWKKKNGNPATCETVVLAYFVELFEAGKKPTSLWAYYSMLKSIVRIKEKIDIGNFFELTAFLKRKSEGYEPVKSNVFEDYELQRFLFTADKLLWLDVKVVCILGIFGAMRGCELLKLRVEEVIEEGNLYMVWVKKTKTKKNRYFTIHGPSCDIVKRYIGLRPPNTETDRFLLNYQNGICIHQGIGKQKIGTMPCRIAEFLGLPDTNRYTGHSFRRSAASLFANTGAGMDAVKNLGGWVSTKVAEGYVENSLAYKKRTGSTISASLIGETPNTSQVASSSSSTVVSGPAQKKRKVTSQAASSSSSTVGSASGPAEKKRKIAVTSTIVSTTTKSKPLITSTIVSTVSESAMTPTAVASVRNVPESLITSPDVFTASTSNDHIASQECSVKSLPDFEVYETDTGKVEEETAAVQFVASKGYVETEDDNGFKQTADDNIDDFALQRFVEQEQLEQQQSKKSVASLQNVLGRHFSFTNCSVTININD